jgi:hypothetical protein
MADPHVSLTLTFRTDTPPTAVAMQVTALVANHIPESLCAANWHGFDLEDEGTEEEVTDGDA